MDESLTTGAVAAELGMSPRWVEQQIAAGRLPAAAWGTGARRVYRIRRDDLERFRRRYLCPARELLAAADADAEEA
ncbi:MAG: helix-turn-helix domain-containing protein [Candidatus Limnocylindrales bacterium]